MGEEGENCTYSMNFLHPFPSFGPGVNKDIEGLYPAYSVCWDILLYGLFLFSFIIVNPHGYFSTLKKIPIVDMFIYFIKLALVSKTLILVQPYLI